MIKSGNGSQSNGDGRGAPDRERGREASNARTRRAERAARMVLRDGPIRRHTRSGEVMIREVRVETSPEGLDYLDVIITPGVSEEPHFRIFNPPTGVRRPDGSIEEDPVAALAEVLALHGGALRRKRRTR